MPPGALVTDPPPVPVPVTVSVGFGATPATSKAPMSEATPGRPRRALEILDDVGQRQPGVARGRVGAEVIVVAGSTKSWAGAATTECVS